MNQTEKEILASNPWDTLSPENREIYESAIKKAFASGEEESCETWRTCTSKCCGEDTICVRSSIRVIGRTENEAIIYAMVQNITKEKLSLEAIAGNEKKLRFAVDQSNTFAWEYSIDTKEMRPCSRCQRVLGMPPLLKNYPEPVIESGLFPADYADMYREWHRQLEDGVGELEAVIPLTADRIPFHVRYTTEFDETGRPLKAYGSATAVVDNK